jgi:hypothetical protein
VCVQDKYDSEVQFNKISLLISWACKCLSNKGGPQMQDWEMAQALVESAIKFSQDYSLDHSPWNLIPDEEYAPEIRALIEEKMSKKYAEKKINLKELLEPEKEQPVIAGTNRSGSKRKKSSD